MKKSMIMLIAAPLFLAGCQGSQPSNIPVQPKPQGPPYHIVFGALPAKHNPAVLTLPPVRYTANPEDVETRADLVVKVDLAGTKKVAQMPDMMIMAPTDISGTTGSLSADYVDAASKDLSKMLSSYCMKGKVNLSVALVRSSLPIGPTDDQVNDNRLSDWTPIVVDFKNPHPKC